MGCCASLNMIQVCINMIYSTAQAAKLLNVGRATLHRWMRDGKVRAPRTQRIAGVSVRVWTGKDVERAQRYKQQNYRKGRGHKLKPKR
jgi:excisionase family DNA binding protein